MCQDYIRVDTAKLRYESGGKSRTMELLWGDQVEVLQNDGATATIRARSRTGTVAASALGGEPLLEVYIIDVGQGDGVLIVTPDRRHVLVDGGYIRERQPTGKNAADFVDWKFARDYRQSTIKLDAMIASHCDADHYGGLWDLLSFEGKAREELDARNIEVDVLYHAGVSWWENPNGPRWLGPMEEIDGEDYLTQLLGDEDHVRQCLNGGAGPQLQGEWARFMQTALDRGCDIRRLSHEDGWVPGFEPDEAGENATLRIIAPVVWDDGTGRPMVRAYTRSKSQNTNGHSLLLSLGYGRTRILLTGDLNKRSMQAIMQDAEAADLACDVAKGCHHGSDDIAYSFLQAMGPSATVISSGDNEGHAHPRPTVVAASAQTGHVEIHNDEMRTPLIYSTEISRSIDIGKLLRIDCADYPVNGDSVDVALDPKSKANLNYEVVKAGDLRPKKIRRRYHKNTRVVDAVTYGLVNVRTDGRKILCATLNEKQDKWEVETFQSRF